MRDEQKHKIAKGIYTTIQLVKKEILFLWKPIAIGLGIFLVFLLLSEVVNIYWQDGVAIAGLFLAFVPLLWMYFNRVKNWVIKWKEPLKD